MAFTNYIQQIKDTGGTTHDLVDTSASHYVKGTQTSSTNAWTGALPDGVTAYYDGLSIDYFLPYAGTSTAATLNLGGKGAKPVYVGNGTGGVTTHFPVNSVIHLTYIINSALNSGNGCWKVTGYYNTNDDYRVRTVARGTTKAYVLGTTTAPTSSNQNVTSVSETGVYFDTTAATLVATTFKGALTGTASGNLTSSSTLDATKLSGTIPTSCYTNTKNTAGSTDTSSKIFLIGATSQAANPQTYSHDTAYVGTDGCLYSGGSKVLTAHQTATATPTANTVSKFDGSAHMNSTDMTTSEITSFLEELGNGVPALIDLFYPVGSYYETSNSSFDPNNAWGGTWEKEAEGLVHIGSGSTYSLGSTGGEKTHTLTVAEMPSHNHDLPRVMGFVNSTGGGNGTYGSVNTWTTVGNRGGGGAHNNMQPYVVVNRWHRTA